MKTSIKVLIATVAVFSTATAFKLADYTELEIGKAIPSADVKMLDISGKEVSLADAKGENGLLVVFSCNTCPYVKLSESRIKELSKLTKANKVGFILLNSNEAQRGDEDSYDEMKKYAKAQGYDFYYAVDKNSAIANAFGASRTPHCFLFDKKGLAYRGAIDDNIKSASDAKELYLKDAIVAVGTGKAVKTNSSKSVGCSIKRVE
ncbi:MAG: thioredoxin family protein [Bacteroidetes bacterium]|nr:thioredoxin family protein [Bacteroidota bacterium]